MDFLLNFVLLIFFSFNYVEYRHSNRPENGAGSPGARVTGDCKKPHGGYWKLNWDPPKEHVFFIAEPSL